MPRKYKIHDYAAEDPKKPKKATAQLWEVKAFPRSKDGNSGPGSFPKPAWPWPPFERDPKPPATGDPKPSQENFKAWQAHYVGMVGYYVSILNGLQFDLEKHQPGGGGNKKDILAEFSTQIDEFAKAFHIFRPEDFGQEPNPHGPPKPGGGRGSPNGADKDPLAIFPQNPTQLVWPLCGRYYFRYHFRRVENAVPVYDYFADLELFFECDQNTYLCTNCVLKLRVSDRLQFLEDGGLDTVAAVAIQDPDYISSSSSYLATSSSSSP